MLGFIALLHFVHRLSIVACESRTGSGEQRQVAPPFGGGQPTSHSADLCFLRTNRKRGAVHPDGELRVLVLRFDLTSFDTDSHAQKPDADLAVATVDPKAQRQIQPSGRGVQRLEPDARRGIRSGASAQLSDHHFRAHPAHGPRSRQPLRVPQWQRSGVSRPVRCQGGDKIAGCPSRPQLPEVSFQPIHPRPENAIGVRRD